MRTTQVSLRRSREGAALAGLLQGLTKDLPKGSTTNTSRRAAVLPEVSQNTDNPNTALRKEESFGHCDKLASKNGMRTR